MTGSGGKKPEAGIYIECVIKGALMQVSAIDAATATEVSVFGPANARTALIANATAKLRYMLKKRSE